MVGNMCIPSNMIGTVSPGGQPWTPCSSA
jgi:hypothetical protein